MIEWRYDMENAPRDEKVLAFNYLTGPYVTIRQGDEWPMHGWDQKVGVWYPQPTAWAAITAPEPRAD